MRKRHKLKRKNSKRMFTRNAEKTHRLNTRSTPTHMRGGIRL
jgi:hypothetical protein